LNAIKKLRKQQKITQIVLAKNADIDRCFLSAIENGKSTPTLKTLRKIARALGCRVAELIDDDDE
jgi:transcriptional regulator with XRE-family HTH domain